MSTSFTATLSYINVIIVCYVKVICITLYYVNAIILNVDYVNIIILHYGK